MERLYKKGNFPKGFTLIEIMVVIIMIGILASIAFPMYLNHAKKAKMSDVILSVKSIATYLSEKEMEGKPSSESASIIMDKLGIESRYFDITISGDEIIAKATEDFSSSTSGGKGGTFSYTYKGDPSKLGFQDEDNIKILETYAEYVLKQD